MNSFYKSIDHCKKHYNLCLQFELLKQKLTSRFVTEQRQEGFKPTKFPQTTMFATLYQV